MEQSTAFEILKSNNNVFLTSSAGCGKSYLIKQLVKHYEEEGVEYALTASTGVAALLIGGSTIHSYAGIGIKSELTQRDISLLRMRKGFKEKLCNLQVLIVDEISMLHRRQLELVDYVFKTMRQDYRPFGGVKVILVGDMLQLSPIGPEPINDRFVFMSKTWTDAKFKICYLTKVYRQTEGDPLLDILNHIRAGTVTEEHEAMIESTENHELDEETSTLLYTHNADIGYINNLELEKIDSPAKVFVAKTKGSANYLKNLIDNILTPTVLTLKVGAKVMLTKNHPEGLYVNGTVGVITRITANEIVVRKSDKSLIHIEKVSWETKNDEGKVLASFTQFPFILAWAISIHKSQGVTLESAIIDLSKSFVPSLGYVALSRVSSFSGLKVLGYNNMALQVLPLALKADKRFRELSDELEKEYVKTSS